MIAVFLHNGCQTNRQGEKFNETKKSFVDFFNENVKMMLSAILYMV